MLGFWKKTALAVLVLVGSRESFAQEPGAKREKVLEAQKIVLKDEAGTVRIEIGIRRGGPYIDLLNPGGTVGATLNIEDIGRGLVILGPDGDEQIALGKASGNASHSLTIKAADGRALFATPGTSVPAVSQNTNEASWRVPVAIVISGIFIGAGLYFGRRRVTASPT